MRKPPPAWQSPLGPLIAQFIQEKQACGYTYATEQGTLRRLDRFLAAHGLAQIALPRNLVELWSAKHTHESARTHWTRVGLLRRLATFVARHGYPAYIPPASLPRKAPSSFTPYILSHTEVRRLLDAVDRLRPTGHAPLRHRILPALFRVLYSCGLRVSEALRLRCGDVVPVRGRGPAGRLCQRCGAPADGVRFRFDDENAGAFGQHATLDAVGVF